MRALRLMDWKSDPVLTDVADPSPGPGQVVIRVGGAGACHSDLFTLDEAPGAYRRLLAGEITGRAVAVPATR